MLGETFIAVLYAAAIVLQGPGLFFARNTGFRDENEMNGINNCPLFSQMYNNMRSAAGVPVSVL